MSQQDMVCYRLFFKSHRLIMLDLGNDVAGVYEAW